MLHEDRELVSQDYPLIGSSRISLGAGTIRIARFLEGIVRRLPGPPGMLNALGMPLEEGFRFIVTAGKMYDQKRGVIPTAEIPRWLRRKSAGGLGRRHGGEITAIMEEVYITGETAPSTVVSNHSALFIFRRNFILAVTWTALVLLVIAVLAGAWHIWLSDRRQPAPRNRHPPGRSFP